MSPDPGGRDALTLYEGRREPTILSCEQLVPLQHVLGESAARLWMALEMKPGLSKSVLKGNGVRAADIPAGQTMRSQRRKRLPEHTA